MTDQKKMPVHFCTGPVLVRRRNLGRERAEEEEKGPLPSSSIIVSAFAVFGEVKPLTLGFVAWSKANSVFEGEEQKRRNAT